MDVTANARLKLKKKFANARTGGKGSIRRKKKNTRGYIVRSRITEIEKNYNKYIENINTNINDLNTDFKESWNVYIDDWAFDTINDFRKKDFQKSKKIDIDYIKEHYQDFFESKFIEQDDNGTIIFMKNYEHYKNIFSEQGYNYMMEKLNDLAKIIDKKEFVHTSEKQEIIDVHKLYDVLNLESTSVPSKSELKKAYLKMSCKFHPDKHPNEIEKYSKIFQEINSAYRQLSAHYYNTNDKHLYTT